MATIRLPTESKEFLKLLNSGDVDYLAQDIADLEDLS
jgi:hypothetical protein